MTEAASLRRPGQGFKDHHMLILTAHGARADIEAAGNRLADRDPTPALAVDTREDGRRGWVLDVYVADQLAADESLSLIAAAAPGLSPTVAEVEDRDWVALSLEGLPPVQAGRFVVAGGHAVAAGSPGKTKVLIEAGPAFGTGHHGTTRGCLLALEDLIRRRRPTSVLDLGSGSGVLAIAALKAGARFAVGTDIDGDSVRVAIENARKNQVARRFKAFVAAGGRTRAVIGRGPYDVVFANILARPLVRLAPEVARLTRPGGAIILSGLLTYQEPQVRGAFAGRGLTLTSRRACDGWLTLGFDRPKPA